MLDCWLLATGLVKNAIKCFKKKVSKKQFDHFQQRSMLDQYDATM